MSSTLSLDKKDAELEGLDKLQTDVGSQKSLKTSLVRVFAPLTAVVVLIAIWQIYVLLSGKRPDVVPGPLDVAGTFGQLWAQGTLQEAVWTSVQRGVIGFVGSAVIGTALGLTFGASSTAPYRIRSADFRLTSAAKCCLGASCDYLVWTL